MTAIRFHRRVLSTILAVVGAAVFAVSAASASSSPDAVDRFLQNGQSANATPDAIARMLAQRDQPLSVSAPDAVDRWLANHPTAVEPDVIARVLAQDMYELATAPRTGIDPIDLMVANAREQLTTPPGASTQGIDWADAGIGAGIAVGALLLTAAAALAVRRQRRPAHF